MYSEARRQDPLLVVADRLQRHLLPHALPGAGRHAASLCRLPHAVCRLQRDRLHRLLWASALTQVYFFLFVVLPAMRGKGAKAPQKPWDGAEGLEWEVPSPAPFHTFENPPSLTRPRPA